MVVEGIEFAPQLQSGVVTLAPVAEVAFVRGDCNTNGSMALTDAVTMLNFMFGNGGIAQCMDACDANDSGALNLADAVHVLNYMFAGGPEPTDPFSDCGLDPTGDLLDCANFDACAPCE